MAEVLLVFLRKAKTSYSILALIIKKQVISRILFNLNKFRLYHLSRPLVTQRLKPPTLWLERAALKHQYT